MQKSQGRKIIRILLWNACELKLYLFGRPSFSITCMIKFHVFLIIFLILCFVCEGGYYLGLFRILAPNSAYQNGLRSCLNVLRIFIQHHSHSIYQQGWKNASPSSWVLSRKRLCCVHVLHSLLFLVTHHSRDVEILNFRLEIILNYTSNLPKFNTLLKFCIWSLFAKRWAIVETRSHIYSKLSFLILRFGWTKTLARRWRKVQDARPTKLL